jgi:hypothetical protein
VAVLLGVVAAVGTTGDGLAALALGGVGRACLAAIFACLALVLAGINKNIYISVDLINDLYQKSDQF